MYANIWLINSIDEFNIFTMSGGKVVIIADDPDPYIKNNPAALMAKVLLPSYEVVSAEINEEYQLADSIYFSELNNEESNGYILSILAALYSGISIGIYFGSEESSMRFVQVFLNYLAMTYGIIIGTANNQPQIIDSYNGDNIDKIYFMGLMSFADYIIKRPGLTTNEWAINKMVYDVKPPVTNYDYPTLIDFFGKLKEDVDKYGKYYPLPFERNVGEKKENLPL